MTPSSHDHLEVDALQTDRYLESLLLARERHATDSPADPSVDPAIRSAARRLARDLGRIHPSFRFEERLAARLAEMADRMRLPAAAGDGGQIVPVPISPELTVMDQTLGGDEPLAPRPHDADAPERNASAHANADSATTPQSLPRPLIIGSAITSAALSLAGAAFVAWRLSRPGAHPMARAARAARSGRGPAAPSPRGTRPDRSRRSVVTRLD